MHQDNIPSAHIDPSVDLTRSYITHVVRALSEGGVEVERSWLDPQDPRDATIVYRPDNDDDHFALVWDEVTGWRRGRFESGEPGVRTVLSAPAYLGGGLLPEGAELTQRLLTGMSEPRREYRSGTDQDDGLDDALDRFS